MSESPQEGVAPACERRTPLLTIFLVFLRLGFTSFGGPVAHLGYFRDEETMKEGNPQLVLERGEQESLPPTLLIHGAADAAVPNAIPEKYALTYSNAGGAIELRMFEGMHHNFAREPLPESHQAINMIKDFISEHIN